MFFFVFGWCYWLVCVQASFYMVFYTLVVSFPFLIYLSLFGLNRLRLNFFFFFYFFVFFWGFFFFWFFCFFLFFFFFCLFVWFFFFFFSIVFVGGVLRCFLCFRQVDLKAL